MVLRNCWSVRKILSVLKNPEAVPEANSRSS